MNVAEISHAIIFARAAKKSGNFWAYVNWFRDMRVLLPFDPRAQYFDDWEKLHSYRFTRHELMEFFDCIEDYIDNDNKMLLDWFHTAGLLRYTSTIV
jgi:hypothetical protein